MTKFKLVLVFILGFRIAAMSQEFEAIKVAFENKNYDQTITLCEKYLQGNKPNADLYGLRGRAFVEKGWYTLAIEDLTHCIEMKSTLAGDYAQRGFAYFMMRDYKLARNDFIHAVDLDSTHAVYAFNLAKCEQLMGKLREAIYSYTLVIKRDPYYGEAYKNRGIIQFKGREFNQALHDFDSALKYMQGNDEVLLYRGMALSALKRYKEAMNMFDRCIKHNAHNSNAWFNKGMASMYQRDFVSAKARFDTAILYDQSLEIAYFNRALCDLELSGRKASNACDDFKKAAGLGYMEALEYIRRYCQ